MSHMHTYYSIHWTKIEISYMSRLPTHDISYTYLAEDKVEFYAIKWNV